ncbi:hypothetical protein V5799_013688 [Amblyomma americanum]|uniref:Uncharacterized protein n=1 Tax=Amblyomma americanum TaxID=6943 RepID=A0AAQ4E586_AMBAM
MCYPASSQGPKVNCLVQAALKKVGPPWNLREYVTVRSQQRVQLGRLGTVLRIRPFDGFNADTRLRSEGRYRLLRLNLFHDDE